MAEKEEMSKVRMMRIRAKQILAEEDRQYLEKEWDEMSEESAQRNETEEEKIERWRKTLEDFSAEMSKKLPHRPSDMTDEEHLQIIIENGLKARKRARERRQEREQEILKQLESGELK